MKSSTFVIIPGFNESKYLADVLKDVSKITKNIIYVDDGSSDNSVKIAKRYTSHVLVHLTNLGKGAAMKTGAEYAFGQLSALAIIFMDSDNQHDAQDLPAFFKALESHQVVFGERALDHRMPLTRIIGNRLASVLNMIMFGQYIPDIPCGYQAMTKKAYRQIKWKSSDYAVEMELAARVSKAKLDYVTIPVKTIYHDLDRGMNFLDILKMIGQIISWRISL